MIQLIATADMLTPRSLAISRCVPRSWRQLGSSCLKRYPPDHTP